MCKMSNKENLVKQIKVYPYTICTIILYKYEHGRIYDILLYEKICTNYICYLNHLWEIYMCIHKDVCVCEEKVHSNIKRNAHKWIYLCGRDFCLLSDIILAHEHFVA
jgi:hypothetical protein